MWPPGGQKNVQEEKEKKMAAKQVAVEREKMLARRSGELCVFLSLVMFCTQG